MAQSSKYLILDEDDYPSANVWLVTELDADGEVVRSGPIVTFDRINIEPVYHLFSDYPHKLTDDQVAAIKHDLPFWAEFFKDRLPKK